MSSWKHIAGEFERDARLLQKRGCHRSSVNRFYYAAYALASDLLQRCGVQFKSGRLGPAHQSLPDHLIKNASTLPRSERKRAAAVIAQLYAMRCRADYHPSDIVGDGNSRGAAGRLVKLKEIM